MEIFRGGLVIHKIRQESNTACQGNKSKQLLYLPMTIFNEAGQ